ncbi:LysR substrate-binding domain-containing protein [Janibacter sp. LM]|uniref:LysR substrate-binding domain-containing protein n=1 Tax=Janibacter sp. LM TaxID=3144845 RepID=UPI0031F68DFD
MELKHLRAFLIVAEELHFSRAAERLHMAQPPLSHLIKQLEADLGCMLFERTTRRVRLTSAGEVYREHVEVALADLDRAREAALMALGGDRGRIVVGLTGITTGLLLPQLARAYRLRYPNVQLDLRPEPFSGANEEALLDRRIDVAFLRHRVSTSALTGRLIAKEALVAAVPAHHPLAQASNISIADLADENFVAYPPGQGSSLRGVFFSACSDAGFRPRIIQEVKDTQMMASLVSAEVGVAVLPDSVARFNIEGVTFRPLAESAHHLPVYLAWRSEEPSPALQRLLEMSEEIWPADPA